MRGLLLLFAVGALFNGKHVFSLTVILFYFFYFKYGATTWILQILSQFRVSVLLVFSTLSWFKAMWDCTNSGSGEDPKICLFFNIYEEFLPTIKNYYIWQSIVLHSWSVIAELLKPWLRIPRQDMQSSDCSIWSKLSRLSAPWAESIVVHTVKLAGACVNEAEC